MNVSTRSAAIAKTFGPFSFWAGLGVFWMLFQAYVLGSWVTGPYFVAIEPGPDPISDGLKLFLLLCQTVTPIVCIVCLWRWIVVPWRREGRLTSDAMIVIAATMIWFWDFSPSFIVDQVQYNSHMFNRGSWGLHAWPGWVGPAGHRVAEPLFFIAPGYIVFVLSQVFFICWLLRKLKDRRPHTGIATFIAAIVVGLFFVDSIVETLFLRTGFYAYPAAIRAFTLFPGETYQFPLTEGILFGGFALGSIGILMFFKDDKGQTFVERGIERLTVSAPRKQLLRVLSIYGYVHTAFFALYMMPGMLVAVNGDAYPDGYPSWLQNGMCLYGEQHNQCPGPGVSIPRPAGG